MTFAFLFAGESLLRALNVSVIPLQARELLGSSQRVSVVATCVSATVLLTTLSMPFLLRNVRRRWTYTIGIALIVTAAVMFASYTIVGQVLGQYLRNTGAAVLNVTLSLYIMDHIRKEDLTHSEPLRLAVSTVSWVIGPATGTWLFTYYGSWGAQLAVLVAGLLLLTGFWVARLSVPNSLASGTIASANPFANAWEFFRQPRLRLAWSIAFARSCFWSGIFIYGPLLIVEGGLAKTQAGYVISATQIMLPMSLIYGRIARKSGVRPVIAACFASVAIFTFMAGLFGSAHILPAIACLLLTGWVACRFCARSSQGNAAP
jgi:MFS family permease